MISGKSITKENVLESVRRRGPSIPLDLFRELGGDTLLMGAYLSELYQSNVLKKSSVKIGGSPLYYLDDQREQLQNFSKYLNEKDRRTFDLLKDKKVLKDLDQTPLIQISLRNIKDFSIPLLVKINGLEEQFFKWYLFSNDEATEEIRKIISGSNKTNIVQSNETIEKNKQDNVEKKLNIESNIKPLEISPLEINNYFESKPTHVERSDKIKSQDNNKKEKNSILDDYSDNKIGKQSGKKSSKISSEDSFTESLSVFFESRNIEIKKQTIDRKGKENSYELDIPSEVGHISFVCKAIKKSKVTDSDLSKCYVQLHSMKLPMLFLYDGELSKKALDLSMTFINFIIKKIE